MTDWKWIPGYEGLYKISSDGEIYSVPRSGTSGGVLKTTPTTKGYLHCHLTKDGVQRTAYPHKLVLLVFVGPSPVGMQACHNNGVSADNRLENLRWDTPSANNLDKRRHGTSGGERNGRAKLTWDDVREIRQRYAEGGVSYSGLARQFGVDKTAIAGVVSGHTWKEGK